MAAEYELVTCPETAHLELLELERHPLGILIAACSRFRPPCDVTCPRTCAARMDRRGRTVEVEDITALDLAARCATNAL